MKKTLGLLALTLVVSATATAKQDFVKKVSLDVKGVYDYEDRNEEKVTEGDKLGNEGFRKVNKTGTAFEKELKGTVVLHNEGGVEADFKLVHKESTGRKGNERENYKVKLEHELKLRKDNVMFGDLKTDWYAKYNGSKERTYDAKKMKKESKRGDNKYELGTKFKPHELLTVNPLLYYVDKKENDEWGAKLKTKIAKGGEIAKTSFGTVSYDLGFNHDLTYVLSKKNPSRKRSKVDLKYTQELKYTTPKLYGFEASVALSNEWKRNTVNSGWENEFVVPVELNYTHVFKTSAGDIEVKPYAKYEALKRSTKYNKTSDKEFNTEKVANKNKKLTTESNQAVLGLNVTLNVK